MIKEGVGVVAPNYPSIQVTYPYRLRLDPLHSLARGECFGVLFSYVLVLRGIDVQIRTTIAVELHCGGYLPRCGC